MVLLGICFLCDYSSCLPWEKSRMARAGACYGSRFGWICPLAAGHHPSPSVPHIPWHKDMSQWHGGSPWGWEVLLICISGLQAHTGIFGEQRTISLTQITFNLLCYREENQALILKSCRRSTRSPLAYLQCVSEGNANAHGPVIWQLSFNSF